MMGCYNAALVEVAAAAEDEDGRFLAHQVQPSAKRYPRPDRVVAVFGRRQRSSTPFLDPSQCRHANAQTAKYLAKIN